MTTIQPNKPSKQSISQDPKPLCQIVGLACLAGFMLDFLTLLYPPQLGSLAWRVSVLQQLSDRSIILLLGAAFLMYGVINFIPWRKWLAFTCLGLGAAFILSGIWFIKDGLALQEQALASINAQQQQIQGQIQKAQKNPQLVPNVTPEKLQQASQSLTLQAESAKKNAQTGTFKTSFAGFGNLLVVGLALIGLGQYGVRPPRS